MIKYISFQFVHISSLDIFFLKSLFGVKLKVVHVIVGLGVGGAENMLFRLLAAMDKDKFQSEVISLTDEGQIGAKISALGIPLYSLGMQDGKAKLKDFMQLTRLLRKLKPDCVQTWMYHADLIGGLAAKLAGVKKIAWNIRCSRLTKEDTSRSTLLLANLCAKLSRRAPDRIICCSEASRITHTGLGYDSSKMRVIPNGYDLSAFKPFPFARDEVRSELGLPLQTPLIGLVARFDPLKDHLNFVEAAAILSKIRKDVHFVLCGSEITIQNAKLFSWIEERGLTDKFHLLGRREDVPRLNAAMDVASCSSFSEGFPNVIAEAMACGTPCVVTNAGDSSLIVGNTGYVVPARDPQKLAEGWEKMLALSHQERNDLGAHARRRVEEMFEIGIIARQYEEVYEQNS